MTVFLCKFSDMFAGESRKFTFTNRPPIALFRLEDGYFATDDTCTHAAGSLSEGFIEGDCVVCPVHPGEFDIRTGRAQCFPVEKDLAVYSLRIADDQIFLDIEV